MFNKFCHLTYYDGDESDDEEVEVSHTSELPRQVLGYEGEKRVLGGLDPVVLLLARRVDHAHFYPSRLRRRRYFVCLENDGILDHDQEDSGRGAGSGVQLYGTRSYTRGQFNTKVCIGSRRTSPAA